MSLYKRKFLKRDFSRTILFLCVSFGTFVFLSGKEIDRMGTDCHHDVLTHYRDTIVGRFNGVDVDTLICEPFGQRINDELFGEFYMQWRIYTVKGTVEELKVGNTIGLKFVKEGDVDGNRTEEWGFLTQWPTSSWTIYNVFTCEDGRWKLMVDSIRIWREHLETSLTESDIVQPSGIKNTISIKCSETLYDDEVIYWEVKDSIAPIAPKEYIYELVEW